MAGAQNNTSVHVGSDIMRFSAFPTHRGGIGFQLRRFGCSDGIPTRGASWEDGINNCFESYAGGLTNVRCRCGTRTVHVAGGR